MLDGVVLFTLQAMAVCLGVGVAVVAAIVTFCCGDNVSRLHVVTIGSKLALSDDTMTFVHVCRVFLVGLISLLVCASIVQATLSIVIA